MRRISAFIIVFALFVSALGACAQEPGNQPGQPPQGQQGPQGGPGGQPPMMNAPQEHFMVSPFFLEALGQKLALTAEQKAKVKGAIAGSKETLDKKFVAVRKMHEEMSALEKELGDKISALLTDEQKKKFEEMERLRPGPGMRPGGPGPGPGMGGPQGGMPPGGKEGGHQGKGHHQGQGGGQQPQHPQQEASGGGE